MFLLNISINKEHRNYVAGNSLAVPWLGLCTLIAEGVGSIPSWGTKTPQAMAQPKRKRKKEIMLQITLLGIYLLTKHYYIP